jgi:hypothetical protein
VRVPRWTALDLGELQLELQLEPGARRLKLLEPSSSGCRAVAIEHYVCSCCRGERPHPAEILIAARRLAGARPHLAAVAGIVHHEDLWQLCRDELTGVDVRIDGWDIRGRWFGVVGATRRTGGVATR